MTRAGRSLLLVGDVLFDVRVAISTSTAGTMPRPSAADEALADDAAQDAGENEPTWSR